MKKYITYILLIVAIVLSAMFLLSKTNTGNVSRSKIVTRKTIIKKPIKVKEVKKPENIIYIQPLGDVNYFYITKVKTAIETFYHTKCVVKEKIEFTDDILAKSKTRYDADKILSKYNSKENQLFLTEKDIACKAEDRHSNEWGIFGLGYRPGSICIVSTFRLKKNVGSETIIDRLTKISLHEVGHNLGLGHCTNNKNCMMNDADGTITQVDREWVWMCSKCQNFLKHK
jgi:archaemetzincin